MTTRKTSGDSLVDTGGGAYVGGDVNTGGGDFVGRDKKTDNSVSIGGSVSNSNIITGSDNQIKQSQSGTELGDLLKLLQELKAQVADSGLEDHTQKMVEASIDATQVEAQKEQPKGELISSYLNTISGVLEAAGNATEKGKTLLSTIKSAIALAGTLF